MPNKDRILNELVEEQAKMYLNDAPEKDRIAIHKKIEKRLTVLRKGKDE